MKIYINQHLIGQKPSLIVRVLIWVGVMLALAGLFVVGFFAFIIGLGVVITLWLASIIHRWWFKRKYSNRHDDYIEVEYREH